MVKPVDKEKWNTINKIAMPWNAGTAMAAEVAAARVLAEVLGLVLTEQMTEQTALNKYWENCGRRGKPTFTKGEQHRSALLQLVNVGVP